MYRMQAKVKYTNKQLVFGRFNFTQSLLSLREFLKPTLGKRLNIEDSQVCILQLNTLYNYTMTITDSPYLVWLRSLLELEIFEYKKAAGVEDLASLKQGWINTELLYCPIHLRALFAQRVKHLTGEDWKEESLPDVYLPFNTELDETLLWISSKLNDDFEDKTVICRQTFVKCMLEGKTWNCQESLSVWNRLEYKHNFDPYKELNYSKGGIEAISKDGIRWRDGNLVNEDEFINHSYYSREKSNHPFYQREIYSSNIKGSILQTYRRADIILKGVLHGYIPGTPPIKIEHLAFLPPQGVHKIWIESQPYARLEKEGEFYRIVGPVLKIKWDVDDDCPINLSRYPEYKRLEELIRMGFYLEFMKRMGWRDVPLEYHPSVEGELLLNIATYERDGNSWKAATGGIIYNAPEIIGLPTLTSLVSRSSPVQLSIFSSLECNKLWLGIDVPLDRKECSTVSLGWGDLSLELSFDNLLELVITEDINADVKLETTRFDEFKISSELINSVVIHEDKGLLINKTVSVYITEDAKSHLETRYGISDDVAKILAAIGLAKGLLKNTTGLIIKAAY